MRWPRLVMNWCCTDTRFWTPTASLVQELLAAKRDLHLPQLLAKLDRYECVFLDDIGYVQHDQVRARDGGALYLPG